jgi:hypothetical protein
LEKSKEEFANGFAPEASFLRLSEIFAFYKKDILSEK